MANDTHTQTQKLLQRPRPFMIRIAESLGTSYAYGMPDWRYLPADIRDTAKDLEFRPVCFVRSGFLPFLVHVMPFWVGPEGYARLDANADGNFHLRVLMTDGTDFVVTKQRPSSTNPMIYIPATDDFRHDYRELLDVVRQRMESSGESPIHMADQLDVRAVFRAFNHLHRPVWVVMLLLVVDLGLVAALGLIGYLIVT